MQRTQLTSPDSRAAEILEDRLLIPDEVTPAPTLIQTARAIFNQTYTISWGHPDHAALYWGEAYVHTRLFREEAADPASEWDTRTLEEIAEILCDPSRPWEGIVDEEGIDQHEGA